MSDREKRPWQELTKQWEDETPFLLSDQAMGQLLQFAKETEQQLAKQKGHIQTLTIKVAELRARLRLTDEEGGQDG